MPLAMNTGWLLIKRGFPRLKLKQINKIITFSALIFLKVCVLWHIFVGVGLFGFEVRCCYQGSFEVWSQSLERTTFVSGPREAEAADESQKVMPLPKVCKNVTRTRLEFQHQLQNKKDIPWVELDLESWTCCSVMNRRGGTIRKCLLANLKSSSMKTTTQEFPGLKNSWSWTSMKSPCKTMETSSFNWLPWIVSPLFMDGSQIKDRKWPLFWPTNIEMSAISWSQIERLSQFSAFTSLYLCPVNFQLKLIKAKARWVFLKSWFSEDGTTILSFTNLVLQFLFPSIS